MPSMQDLLQAKQSVSPRLLRRGLRAGVLRRPWTLSVSSAVATAGGDVHAVGIGRKIVRGKPTKELCVRFYVTQKLATSFLPPGERLPDTIAGLLTDVIESSPAFVSPKKKRGKPFKLTCTRNRRERQRPIVGGISSAHYSITAGTIAYFCRSTRHGDDPAKIYVLSNNHVFADVNKAQPGDDIYQPGPADGGTNLDHFAEFYRYATIHLGGITPNRVDAALVELLADVQYRVEVCTIGRITGTERAMENMTVGKHGRTTGYTEGIVSDVSYDALVGMDHSDPNVVALFENQLRIERIPPYNSFGEGGDSGSLVVNKARRTAVGLYFAGPWNGSYGVANPIEDVLRELEFEFL